MRRDEPFQWVDIILFCCIEEGTSQGAFIGILLLKYVRGIRYPLEYRIWWTHFGYGYGNVMVILTCLSCQSSPWTSAIIVTFLSVCRYETMSVVPDLFVLSYLDTLLLEFDIDYNHVA